MPSKSPAQQRFMAAAAHDPDFARKAGVPQTVAQEFNQADTGKRVASPRMPGFRGKKTRNRVGA